ncbi:hypothetical protein EDC02_7658 [Micromonospora sp. Llam0]|nr:hypothetical protein EDC02_7658 [Micromonospora sp. Llam0]
MPRDLLSGLDKVRDLLCTPLALEVLDDLAEGRSPSDRPALPEVVAEAIRCLESLGVVRATWPKVSERMPTVEITVRGRTVHERLVEIEKWARCQELDDGTVASGSA